MNPEDLINFARFLQEPMGQGGNWAADQLSTVDRLQNSMWAGMPDVSGLPDQAVTGRWDKEGALRNFGGWMTQAPNKAFQGMRETMGPVLGADMGNRANVMGGMGDLASRAAILSLMTGPVDDPLASYARFIAGGGQGSPAPQTRL